jgi:hypothetical protein
MASTAHEHDLVAMAGSSPNQRLSWRKLCRLARKEGSYPLYQTEENQGMVSNHFPLTLEFKVAEKLLCN